MFSEAEADWLNGFWGDLYFLVEARLRRASVNGVLVDLDAFLEGGLRRTSLNGVLVDVEVL